MPQLVFKSRGRKALKWNSELSAQEKRQAACAGGPVDKGRPCEAEEARIAKALTSPVCH